MKWLLCAAVLIAAACSDDSPSTASTADTTSIAVDDTLGPVTTTVAGVTTTAPPTPASPTTTTIDAHARPEWLGTRVLTPDESGFAPAQPTPPELLDRRLSPPDAFSAPDGDGFAATIEPLSGEPLERSTWHEGCPVPVEELRYATVIFRGFDGLAHTGELIVHEQVANDVVGVFEQLYAIDFPIEEMRIVTPADLDAPPTGDGNNTTAFACRSVTGGTRFSEHAYGLAIDINPFHNPYVKGDIVLPELASAYVDRDRVLPGMILDGDPVVEAFDAIDWGWGGRWNTLKDYQHFAANDR